MDDPISEFYEKCLLLNGLIQEERPPWNDEATVQAIRHFAICVTDDNPLWINKEYAKEGPYRKVTAPPAFVTSVKYPLLHGAKMAVPMSNLANRLEMEWESPIYAGDQLQGTLRQSKVTRGRDRRGRDVIYVETEGTYTNQNNDIVCRSKGTIAWVAKDESDKARRSAWKIHSYSQPEIEKIQTAILSRKRSGKKRWTSESLIAGASLPDLAHPPLSTGDIACWETANGPAYRAGNLGFQDAHAKPLSTVLNPVTGWRVNRVQSHGDHLLAASRGMPGPFDSGVMRFAWVSVFVTDWMGDWATLRRLKVNVVAPLLYGDAMTISGSILKTAETLNEVVVDILIEARNQRNEIISTGEAQVLIPHHAFEQQARSAYEILRSSNPSPTNNKNLPPLAADLVSEKAIKYPERVAIRDSREAFTFLELENRTNQLAHHLISLGAGNNTAVAVILPRGVHWIISALAIQKAGAIYVPIDPAQPKARCIFMLRESQSSILITETGLFPEAENSALKTICFERDAEVIAKHSMKPVQIEIDRTAMAYVMFTSGSTGWPKGAAITYNALASYIKSLANTIALNADDIYLNTATFSFSASIRQTFFPLTSGISQVVADDAQRKDPLKLSELIATHGVTVWDTVPSAWGHAMDRLQAVRNRSDTDLSLQSVRLIMLTGEALHWKLPRQWWRDFNPSTIVINLYSQTETAGSVAYCPLTEDDPKAKDGDMVPLGSTFPDVEIRLLEKDVMLAATPGSQGEICVFGNRLAAGYLNSALHEEKFLSIQCNGSELRYYKTGDLATVGDDSLINFAGRSDRRIKIRGFRVDLGEIESAMNELPEIKESAVTAHFKEGSDVPLGLYAAFVSDKPEETKIGLRDYLSKRLPEYMVPGKIVALDQLPKTASGKLDRDALEAAIGAKREKTSNLLLPRNDTEQKLYAIWQEVLGHNIFSVTDDFFDLGGDSLSALTLVSKIEKVFDREVPLDAIFEKTTVERLAQSLGPEDLKQGQSRVDSTDSQTGELRRDFETLYPIHFRKLVALASGRKGIRSHPKSLIVTITPPNGSGKIPLFFCANGQGEALAMAKELGPDQPLYFLESGFHILSRTNNIIRELGKHHLRDMLQLYPSGPYSLLGYSFGCAPSLVIAEHLEKMNKEILFLGLLDARVGPNRLYRFYFKQIDQKILQHFYFNKKGGDNQSGGIGSLLLHGMGRRIGLINTSKPENTRIPLESKEPPFVPQAISGAIHLFRASDHRLRNFLFPRAGFPRSSFPKLKIISIPGNHHTAFTDGENLKSVGEKIATVLASCNKV